ncbi:MAG: hypothetical protein Q8N99_03920 [Nanoarchaeota archaeon]|nr:hypothetical protein [Nanoarchaeota archaeon]
MKKIKFIAIRRRFLFPDNCHFFDIGENKDTIQGIDSFLKTKFKNIYPRLDKKFLTSQRKRDRGSSYGFSLQYEDGIKNYFIITYPHLDPNHSEKYWMVRGHEEGHALIFFGLENIIEEIAGGKVDFSNPERVANLMGFHAVIIRGLDHLFSEREKTYYRIALIK